MKLKANVGTADKTIRLILALTLIVLFYTGILPDIVGIIGLIMALLLTVTTLLSFCPIYKLLKMSSIYQKKTFQKKVKTEKSNNSGIN